MDEEVLQSKAQDTRISQLIQRQEEEKEEGIQAKKETEEEEVQTRPLIQKKEEAEKEEPQTKPLIQRQEEEETPAKPLIQRQEEEEETVQTQPLIQKQEQEKESRAEKEKEEKENVQTKPLMRKEAQEEQEEQEEPQAKPLIQRQEDEEEPLQTKSVEEEEPVQTQSETGHLSASSTLGSQLAATRFSGSPLPETTRTRMESHFGTDFSNVRVHTDQSAVQMNRSLNAQAFTHGSHIYFGEGRYNPGATGGNRLIAHELTHVVQQGASRRNSSTVTQTSAPVIQRMSWSDVGSSLVGLMTSVFRAISGGEEAVKREFMSHLRRLVRHIPGYRLLTVVLNRDPITRERVERNGRNFIEAGLDVIPGGRLLQRKLQQQGALDQAAAWLDEQLERLDFDPEAIMRQFRRLWDDVRIADVFDPLPVLLRMRDIFQPPIDRLGRFAENVARRLLELVKEYLVSRLINFIRERTRAYPLVRVILEQDPITGEEVPRSGINLIRGFMELSEDGAEKLRQMEETGTLQRAADWIDNAVGRITGNVRRIIAAFENIWDEVTIQNLMDPIDTFDRIFRSFAEPIADIMTFLIQVGIQVLTMIKDALIQRLVAFARTVRGYPLLTVILGRDPFSGERVPRTAENFIRGFLSLLSDGEERFRNLQQSGAIDRAMAWLNNEVERLNLTWEAIRTLFVTAWERLSIGDLANPPAAFQRMVNLFRAPVGRIIRFAAAVGMKILEFVFEGIMGAGGTRVLNILKRAQDTFMTIVTDPVGFLRHLIDAVIQGFRRFGQNIRQHLIAGLTGWLFGALQGAGLELPERWDLRGIISLVLQILGLTYQRIRPRLVRLLGERTVAFLERTFEVVRLLATEGPAAIWRRIVEYAGNLRDRVMEGIRNWVITRVVISGVTYVASLFNPAGAVIQAIRITYNVIMWFIERIQQLMGLVEAISNSIMNIASGNIGAAANYVEESLGRILPLAISLLSRLLGLGGISEQIRRIIRRIRRPIDRAIDRVVRWIARQAMRLIRRGRTAVARVAQWWRQEHTFTTRSGERHRLYYRGSGRNAELMIASNGENIEAFIARVEGTIRGQRSRIAELSGEEQEDLNQVLQLLSEVRRQRAAVRDAEVQVRGQIARPQVQQVGGERLARLAQPCRELFFGWTRLMQTLRARVSRETAGENIDQIVQENDYLRRMWTNRNRRLTTDSARNYFRERVLRAVRVENNLARAEDDFRRQVLRTADVHLGPVRSSFSRAGANICHSKTVAKVHDVIWIIEIFRPSVPGEEPERTIQVRGNRGRYRGTVDRNGTEYWSYIMRLEWASPITQISGNGHAEERVLNVAKSQLSRAITGEWRVSRYSNEDRTHLTLSVDKSPCRSCQNFINDFERRNNATVNLRSPIRLPECGGGE